jgi:hypothetical protein
MGFRAKVVVVVVVDDDDDDDNDAHSPFLVDDRQ